MAPPWRSRPVVIRGTLDDIASPRFFLGLLLLPIAAAWLGCATPATTPLTPTVGTVASLNGVVIDQVGRLPIAGVVVSIPGLSMTTGADGQFAFSDVPQGNTALTARREGLVPVSQVVPLSGAQTVVLGMKPSNAVKMAGNWSGEWTTSSLDRTDRLTLSLGISTFAQTVEAAFDVYGNLVSDYDPPGENFSGTLTSTDALRISRASLVYGNVTADVTTDGRISGSVTAVPIGTATRVDFSGVVTAGTMTINYVITFSNGSTATGTALLAKERG